MRVLLIYPPYERLKGFTVNTVPYNLGQLATCLEENGFYCRVYNGDANFIPDNDKRKFSELNRATTQDRYEMAMQNDSHRIWFEIKDTIVKFDADLIGISCMTATFPVALKIAQIVKSINKDLPVVVGGCHPTVMPHEVINKNEIDYVIEGEGEYSLVQLCDYLDSKKSVHLENIKGLFYKKNGKIVQNVPNEFISDLDNLPLIRRDLFLNCEKYNPDCFNVIMASRGCPYQCTFCSSPAIWKRKVRYRSPINIVNEMNYLWEDYRVRRFRFWDDTFTLNKKYIMEFCNLLIKNKTKFLWVCSVRANTIDDDLLKALKAGGCYSISLGIESGSDRILKLLKKGITVEMVKNAVKLIKNNGFFISSFWIMGIPYETEADMIKTIDFMEELNLDHVNLCTFTPEPMTELYDLCIEEGTLEKNVDWAKRLDLSHHSTKNYFNKNVSRDQYDKLLKRGLQVAERKNRKTLFKKLASFWIQRIYFMQWHVIKTRFSSHFN